MWDRTYFVKALSFKDAQEVLTSSVYYGDEFLKNCIKGVLVIQRSAN